MLSLEWVVAIVLMGAFQLGLGTLIGWYLRRAHEPAQPQRKDVAAALPALHAELVRTSSKELASRLESLFELRQRLASPPTADLVRRTDDLRSLAEQAIQIVKQSQVAIQAVSHQIGMALGSLKTPSALDAAGLAAEQWFPAGRDDPLPIANELRKTRRFPFPHLQSIAPLRGEALPEPASYFEVQFRDISTGGFSFYVTERFDCDRLVARLGTPPNLVPVIARVVYQREVEAGDARTLLVGCEILRRLDP